jgi:hypothetical protein
MICQLCLIKMATRHVTERSPRGRFEEAHYCAECYEAKYLRPPPPADSFPRPRATLKNLMILVGVWAVPNAIAAWVMRSGYVTGTPAQLRQWAINTFLGVNLVLGFFVVLVALQTWLNRVIWHRRTGGLVPMPKQKLTPKQHAALLVRMGPFFAWCVVAAFLERWLTPKIWPIQQSSPRLFVLILCAPLLPIAALGLSKNRWLRDRIWQEWRVASGPERVFRALAMAWTFGFLVVIVMGGTSLVGWGFRIWFPIPPVMLIWIVVQLVLMAAVAMSVRRR